MKYIDSDDDSLDYEIQLSANKRKKIKKKNLKILELTN